MVQSKRDIEEGLNKKRLKERYAERKYLASRGKATPKGAPIRDFIEDARYSGGWGPTSEYLRDIDERHAIQDLSRADTDLRNRNYSQALSKLNKVYDLVTGNSQQEAENTNRPL